jgi:DNA-directed RNA polymerase II subunit RPB1
MNIEPIRTINGIEFAIFGNEDIKNYSAFDKKTNGVSIPELYDNQEPKKNGLIDPRMGSTNDEIICDTCNFNSKYCIGHFGHIKLESPVYHIGYFSYVKKILNCVCIKCSNLRFNKSDEEIAKIIKNKHGKARLNEIINLTKETNFCTRNVNCGSPLPKIKQDFIKSQAKLDLVAEFEEMDIGGKKKLRKKISPLECYNILKNISDEDCILMGFNPSKSRPENMIYQIFPVPPIAVRPSVRVEGLSYIKDDDLTKQLTTIIKSNERLLKNRDSFQKDSVQRLEDSEKLLQVSVASYYDNNSQFMPSSEQKGKAIKSLTSRIKSKKGQLRNNLMGKRTDYSARSVISPDTCISINEVGVPLIVATTLTYPEYVSNANINKLSQYVANGRDKYPGANYVIILNENNEYDRPIDLRFNKNKIELKVGDKVERHLLDGDMVLFNRYPTLHKYSMMGHRVKVIRDKKYATFRLNIGITNPYNADYDGDEMNITVPRTIQSKIELEELADVKKLLINAQTSLPIYGCKIDAVTGAYLLTRDSDIKIPVGLVMNILSYLELPNDKEKYYKEINKKEFYNGKELFSFILPEKINIDDGNILIKNGNLVKGTITSNYISSGKTNSMLRLIFDLYDDEESRKFFDNIQKLTNHFNMWYGFTTSFKDITYTSKISETIKDLIKNVY